MQPELPSPVEIHCFAFNPLRTAILLIGGDKTGRWEEWYAEMIPVADALYDAHLRELREEGAI